MENEAVFDEPLVDEGLDLLATEETVVTYAKYRSRFRIHFKKLTQKYMRSNAARLLVLFAALFSCLLFVMDAYKTLPNHNSFELISNVIVFLIFFIDVIFNLIYADSKIGYIFSFQGFIDCASLLSIVNLAVDSNLVFLPLLRLMRIIKIIRLFRMETLLNVEEAQVTSSNDAIYFETISLVIGICLGWFLAAAILFSIIQNSPETFQYVDSEVELNEYVQFFDCLYIILVLVSTLGFGDFAPANGYGRAFVIIVLLCALTIIPQQVSQLIQMIGQQPAYLGEFTSESGKPHVVVCANLTSSNFQKLVTLILSQGSNDPEVIEDAIPIALLSTVPPSPQMQMLLLHPMNVRKVTFMIGSVNSTKDLIRVKASEALAILIFADNELSDHVDSIERDDYDTKLKVVSTINYLTKEITKSTVLQRSKSRDYYSRIYGKSSGSEESVMRRPVIIAQAHSHEVCFSMLNYGVDRIIGINTFKYSILAFSAIYPGFINLVSSLTIPSSQISLKKKFKRDENFSLDNWKNEYEWGTSFELMEVVIEKNATSAIKDLTFSQLCRYMYHCSKGTAICVAINGFDRLNHLILNPERRVRVGQCSSVFVICNSMEVVMDVMQSQDPITILKRLQKRIFRLQDLIDENLSDDEEDANDHGGNGESSSDMQSNYSSVPTGIKFSTLEISTGPSTKLGSAPRSGSKLSQQSKSVSQRYVFKRATSSFIVPKPKSNNHLNLKNDVHHEKKPRRRLSLYDPSAKPNESSLQRGIRSIPESDLYLRQQSSQAILAPRKYQQHGLHPEHPRAPLLPFLIFRSCARLIIAAIETFVEATRIRSLDHIVILAANADEIEEGAADRAILHDESVKFVKGIPNSLRGLEAVDVCFARCVVIIGNEYKENPDIAGTHNWSFDQDEIKSDLYIVLASLELDALMKTYIKSLEDSGISDSKLPFVIQEVHNAANMTFLSDKYMSSSHKLWNSMNQRIPAAIIPGYKISTTRYDLPATPEAANSSGFLKEMVNKIEDIELTDQSKVSVDQTILLSSPAFAQGRVFTPHIVDAMTIQMLFNPNILEFWQVMMGMQRDSSIGLESKYEMQSVQKDATESQQGSLRHQWRKKRQHPSKVSGPPTQGVFDKLSIPLGFEGKTFQELFNYLLNRYGTVAIGLYRNATGSRPSSYVAILPPQSSIVSSIDEVFVIIPGK